MVLNQSLLGTKWILIFIHLSVKEDFLIPWNEGTFFDQGLVLHVFLIMTHTHPTKQLSHTHHGALKCPPRTFSDFLFINNLKMQIMHPPLSPREMQESLPYGFMNSDIFFSGREFCSYRGDFTVLNNYQFQTFKSSGKRGEEGHFDVPGKMTPRTSYWIPSMDPWSIYFEKCLCTSVIHMPLQKANIFFQ